MINERRKVEDYDNGTKSDWEFFFFLFNNLLLTNEIIIILIIIDHQYI